MRAVNAYSYNGILFSQSENSVISYGWSYAALLDADTISTSTWTLESGNATIAAESNTATGTSANLSGSTGRHRIINKIVTAGGGTHERYIDLVVMDNNGQILGDYC